MRKRKKDKDFDWDMILRYRALPVREKLKWLDQMRLFFDKVTPKTHKTAWQTLIRRGG